MEFEWDPKKAAHNLRKHRVSFAEAAAVFGDPLGASSLDPDYSNGEERFMIIGQSNHKRLLMVAFLERGDGIRIISARELTHSDCSVRIPGMLANNLR